MNLTYAGKDNENNSDIFHFLADGNRPVLQIVVDSQDRMWIGPVKCLGWEMQLTKGTVHRHPTDEADEILANAMNLPVTDICMDAVVNYIVPRIATMMARVYCPKVDA